MNCDICDRELGRSEETKQHMRNQHMKLDKCQKCDFCDKGLETIKEIKQHIKRKHSKQKRQCDFCESSKETKQHMRNQHMKLGYKCPNCDLLDKGLKSMKEIKRNIRNHPNKQKC